MEDHQCTNTCKECEHIKAIHKSLVIPDEGPVLKCKCASLYFFLTPKGAFCALCGNSVRKKLAVKWTFC